MEHCFKVRGGDEEESKAGSVLLNPTHRTIIDQYKQFFDQDQNKEVLHMALDNCAELIVKMHDPRQYSLDVQAALYFDTSFKEHFRQLEKQIHSNWRLHKAYYEAQGQLCQITENKNEALEIIKQMVATLKSRTCSLPVKKLICEKLAQIVSSRPNYQVRDLIHKTMMQVFAVSRTSQ